MGEWIALLDADDLWAPEKLERQVACIRPDTVLVYTGIRFFDNDGSRGEKPAIDPISACKMLRYCNPIPCTYIIRREAVIRDGGYREDIAACEDWEMLVRLQRLGKFEAVVDPLTDIYLYTGSLSANPETMLQPLDQIIDTTLLVGLRGFERWAYTRTCYCPVLGSGSYCSLQRLLKLPRERPRESPAWTSPICRGSAQSERWWFSKMDARIRVPINATNQLKSEPDDPAMMAEVVGRLVENDREFSSGLDLLLLDGGKGQLNTIVRLLEQLKAPDFSGGIHCEGARIRHSNTFTCSCRNWFSYVLLTSSCSTCSRCQPPSR